MRVACAIVFHDNKILVTQRGPGKAQPFKWEFPGGKIHSDETDEAAVVRELMEELNIAVILKGRLTEFGYDYGNFQITLVPFIADLHSGTITLTEHMNYAWLTPEELTALDWAPADVSVVSEVIKRFGGK